MANINNNIIWSKGHNGLKLITKNDSNTDEWDPYESELAAAMFNGIEIFPIQKNSKILCLDKNFELTLNHILNYSVISYPHEIVQIVPTSQLDYYLYNHTLYN